MAWQTPTHSCGHHGEQYQAYGPLVGREKRLAAIEARACPACRKRKAEQAAQQSGLPALTGSDKQIAWASDIRSKMIEALNLAADRARTILMRIDNGEAATADLAKVSAAKNECEDNLASITAILAITEARWWIDHRNEHANTLIIAMRPVMR